MRRHRNNVRRNPRHGNEQGMVIMLVAVFMLFVVGAMAALSIDAVTLYTARSEAQLAADGAALAGARTLANSGMTSMPTNALLALNAENLASIVAIQVAQSNSVGGRNLAAGEVTVSYPNAGSAGSGTNPHVTVKVQRTDVPTFFARIWGSTQVTVGASATAEAYNPSGANALGAVPVAPICVKPWLLPNINPNGITAQIFNPVTGVIQDPTLLGWNNVVAGPPLRARCQAGCGALPGPLTWRYYPADPALANFPPPNAASVQCAGSAGFTPYQLSVAGCVQLPIACNGAVIIDKTPHPTRNLETESAVNCLTHSTANQGDSVDPASVLPQPFQFLSGADNPVVQAGALATGADVMVSDSLVTVPVVNIGAGTANATDPAQVIGFVQLFLNPDGAPVTNVPPYGIKTTIVNLAGCGTGGIGVTPILGNGASPVAVRLISP